MDRNRDARRAGMTAVNGLTRRRHRSGSLRDSPDEDGPVELPESGRLRDRGIKKDRDRDRDRSSRSSKRRRAERLMQGSTREEGMDDSSEESVNGEDDDEEDDGSAGAGAGSVRMLSPNPPQSISPSISNHNHNNNHHRKIFPPSTTTNKVFRAPPAWKAADEMIGVSVPRKARSASTKRSHDCWTTGGGGVVEDQIHRQASTSPVRQNLASTSTPSPAPVSPSSSNASMRKKMKSNGAKLRPPKSSSKPSSNPEELEIEIAEVLYGLMTQSQAPPSDLGKFELNKTSGDAKSRVSSPISNSPSSTHPSAPHNSSSLAPMTAVAPKRKRPRQVSDDLSRRSPINSKPDMDQTSKKETLSPSLEKNHGSTAENSGVSQDLGVYPVGIQPSEPQLTEPPRPDGSSSLLDLMKTLKQGVLRTLEDEAAAAAAASPKKETSAIRPPENLTSSKPDLTPSEMGTHQEKKFQIDLMAPPPPQMKSSPPERALEGGLMEFSSATTITEKRNDQRLLSLKDKEDDKAIKSGKSGPAAEGEEEEAGGPTGKKVKAEEGESERGIVANRVRNNVVDLQFDLENPERETSASTANKLHPSSSSATPPLKHQPASNQILKPVRDDPSTFSDKTAQSNSLPIPISMAGWPGGLPPMGYMAPLQGVVSMDGSGVATAPMQHLFSQPRPKRCATHCYVARNINYFQQLAKMNPFWPAAAAAGTASIFGAKPCNLGVVPQPAEMHRRNVVQQQQDKSQGLNIFPVVGGPENKVSVNMNDANQRSSSSSNKMQQQQVLLQQAMPQPPPPNNVMPGPAFIFPLSQQHSQAGASVRPGSVKSSSSMHSTGASTASSVSGSTPPLPGQANGLSFNYPNMSVGNDTQYLAILQNGYPFPIPTVGGGPAYRGTPHPQSMAYFNGPFYTSQMLHPSQFQQQPQQQQPVVVQQQSNCSSSSSQKHLQAQQQPRPANNNNANVGVVSGNFISFPQSAKDRSQPQSSVQQQQQRQDVGGDDGQDSRVARAYGQNLSVPVHHQNFALMNPPPSTDKKQQSSHQQQQILKGTVESLPQNFAISFASMNGAPNNGASGLDISSSAQNHAVLHNLPEARHGYQMMAQGVQQMKNFRIHEEGKSDSSNNNNMDEEKKGLMVKGGVVSGGGQTIAFSRPEMADASRSVGSTGPNSIPQRQAQIQFQQQQQLMQLHKQQQQLMQQQQQQQPHQLVAAAAAARNKGGGNSASYTSDRSSKFTNNTLTPYPHPQNLVQSGSAGGGDSPIHSPQWKNTRAGSPQVPSSLGSSSNSSSMKNISQQQQVQVQGRSNHPQNQTQISFSGNSKSSMAPQQAPINNHQAVAAASAQCPPVMVGSPTTSSLSKGASGSPRTTTNSNSTSNKTVQPSTLSSQQSKNSSASPSQKTSSLSGQSVLGNPHNNNNNAHHLSSSSQSTINSKTQNLSAKQQMLQPHLFFNPAYMQAAQAAAHPASVPPPASSPAPGGYYIPKRRPDQPNQQPQNCSSPSTSGMLSLCPVSSDVKGATAAGSNTNNAKGGAAAAGQFTAQSVVGGNPHPLIPPGFYGHTIPSAIQVKPPEQKQQQAGGK